MNKTLTVLAKERIGQTWRLYVLIFVPMWLMFFLNNTILLGGWNMLGIEPRTLALGNIVGVLASWTMHGSLDHIIGNSIVMAQILFLFGIFERHAFRTITLMMGLSGVFTWILGADNSIHVGASGLAFSLMGFMLGGAIFAKRWGYLLACVLLGTGFWLAMFRGLIPQDGISFAGHLGGLITGLLYGADSNIKHKRILYRQ